MNWKGFAIACGIGAISPFVFSPGIPKDADYCNVALIPELAEEMGVDVPTRILLAEEGSDLIDSLSGKRDPLAGIGGGSGEISGQRTLDGYGATVKKMLSVGERKVFIKLFRAGEIAKVNHEVGSKKNGLSSNQFQISFGWNETGSRQSIFALQRRLDREFESIIPSKLIAKDLLDHSSDVVNATAAKYLNARSALGEPKVVSRSSQRILDISEANREEMRLETEARRKESREAFDRRVAEMKRESAERTREFEERRERNRIESAEKVAAFNSQFSKASSSPKKPEPVRENYEERVKKMKAEHAAKVAEMKANFDERVRQKRLQR